MICFHNYNIVKKIEKRQGTVIYRDGKFWIPRWYELIKVCAKCKKEVVEQSDQTDYLEVTIFHSIEKED